MSHKYQIDDEHPPILTAKVGDNSDLFPDILALYVPPPALILDMTYGRGVFWKKVERDFDVLYISNNDELDRPRTAHDEQYAVVANDIDPQRGVFSYDFCCLPEEWAGRFDAVVLDPPYMYHSSTSHKKSIDRGYANNERVAMGIHGVGPVHAMYFRGMMEARRVLVPNGVLVIKCQDQIMSGKQYRQHISLWAWAVSELGFIDEDMFVLVSKTTPTMRHKYQLHARKNHSYFLVFRRP